MVSNIATSVQLTFSHFYFEIKLGWIRVYHVEIKLGWIRVYHELLDMVKTIIGAKA